MQISVVLHILIYAWLDYADASQTWLLNNRMGFILSTIFLSGFKQILLVPMQTFKDPSLAEISVLYSFSFTVNAIREVEEKLLGSRMLVSLFTFIGSLFKHNLFLKEKAGNVTIVGMRVAFGEIVVCRAGCLALGSPSN